MVQIYNIFNNKAKFRKKIRGTPTDTGKKEG